MGDYSHIKKGRELTLREIQLVSLEICKIVDKICEENGFRYYLYAGSLLGAVRHKGFIPWDDDIDIVMPRPDYEMFLKYMKEHSEEFAPFKVYNMQVNPDYPYMISRISDERYVLDVDNEDDYGMGIFIDIYPWDGMGNTEAEMKKWKNKASRYSSLCYLSTRKKCIRENTKSTLKLIIKPFAFFYAHLMGKKYFADKLNKMQPQYDYDNSKFVGCLVWGGDGIKGVYPIEWMEPHEKLLFEGTKFRVPKEWDKALTKLFKNYMDLPPENERIPHHCYKAYERV